MSKDLPITAFWRRCTEERSESGKWLSREAVVQDSPAAAGSTTKW
jgi:hypothetical protein